MKDSNCHLLSSFFGLTIGPLKGLGESDYAFGDLDLRRRITRFCPGACGSPFLGEFSFAARTNSSNRFFGTARTPRMTSLKCWNSGVESNGAAFILSPLERGVSFHVPGAYGEEAASSILQVLASQFLVCDTASDNLFHDSGKSLRVRKLPSVVAECLFVNVAKQVKRLNADVGPMQATFQETPEVLHRVGVNVAIHVLNGVVDDGVLIVRLQAIVGFQFIAEYRRARFDAFADQRLKLILLSGINVTGDYPPAALHHSEHNLLAVRSATMNLCGPLASVHIPRLAADEGFVNLYFAAEHVKPAFLHCQTNAVIHEPRGFLCDLESSVKFVGTDAVFATHDQPRGYEPLFKRDGRVLKDGSGLQRERRALMPRIAFPHALLGKPRKFLRAALRTLHDAIRPTQSCHELAAMLKIRKPDNRVSEGIGAFHKPSMRSNVRNVKYVIALSYESAGHESVY